MFGFGERSFDTECITLLTSMVIVSRRSFLFDSRFDVKTYEFLVFVRNKNSKSLFRAFTSFFPFKDKKALWFYGLCFNRLIEIQPSVNKVSS